MGILNDEDISTDQEAERKAADRARDELLQESIDEDPDMPDKLR